MAYMSKNDQRNLACNVLASVVDTLRECKEKGQNLENAIKIIEKLIIQLKNRNY